jgi:hypothetical protein
MRRVKRTFDKAFQEKQLKPIYVAADIPGMGKPWYNSAQKIKYVFSETVKLVYYYFRYGCA